MSGRKTSTKDQMFKDQNNDASSKKPTLWNLTQAVYEPPSDCIREKWPANVNDYMHLARYQTAAPIFERNLDWMLGLRSNISSQMSTRKVKEGTVPDPPSVYYKSLASDGKTLVKRKGSTKDMVLNGNPCETQHLYHHRLGQPASHSQISFEATLRSYRPQTAAPSAKRFNLFTYQKKSTVLDYPEFLPPQKESSTALLSKMPFVKKINHKEFSKNTETISGFEGPQVYGKYDDKAFDNANANDRRHLIINCKPLQQIMWETNLRDFGLKLRQKKAKKAKATEKDKQEKKKI